MPTVIAIVGRANVGKSTLFNRLSRSRGALVDNRPGITRDRLYAMIESDGVPLNLVDTGGFENHGKNVLSEQVKEQVARAIQEADKVIFVVDGRQGVMPGDVELAHKLRLAEKDVYLAVNKIDGPELEQLIHEFYALGIKTLYPISAAHGYGIRTLIHDLVQGLPSTQCEKDLEARVRIAVLGKPNVGKSSLINRILGQERLVVSETPGTTRDAIDVHFHLQGKQYVLIDTAGIRRKSRVKEKIEKFSVIKALKSLDRCHVAIILLDASEGVAEQDERICGYAHERGKGIVLAVNKWDLLRDDPKKRKSLDEAIPRQLRYISYAPKVHLSALTGERVMRLFHEVNAVYEQFCRRFSTASVNKAFREMTARHPAPGAGRTKVKITYATQIGTRPPTFAAFVNRPDLVHFSYERFLVNQLREHFQLKHTPIRLLFRRK